MITSLVPSAITHQLPVNDAVLLGIRAPIEEIGCGFAKEVFRLNHLITVISCDLCVAYRR